MPLPYEMRADAIATAIWEISTNNGRGLDEDLWDSHRQNCQAAVANTYIDNISDKDWHDAALRKIKGSKQKS
jgi:hypothetical protein